MAPAGFDVSVAPTVTAGAYSPNDIVGGLLTFRVDGGSPSVVMVTGVNVGVKAAVTSTLTLLLFDSTPTNGGSVADNAALALAAGDVAKLIKAIPVSTLFDCGTPNVYSADAINVPARAADGTNLYGLLIDGTGWTLVGTSDIVVRLRGVIL